MNDRTPEQINSTLDRTEQILSDLTVRLDRLTVLSEQIGERTNARLTQHDRELDDQDERTERLERDHLEHSSRMAKLEDIQTDMKTMLEILVNRSVGETGGPNE
jgi:hypothetical protein